MSRIVMVTDDKKIDRRIIQQAKSLTDIGHHVIVISRWLPGEKDFDIVDDIRIERFNPQPTSFTEKMLLQFSRSFLDFIKFRSEKIRDHSFDAQQTEKLRLISKFDFVLLSVLPRRWGLSFHERALLGRLKFYRPDYLQAHDLPQLRVCAVAARIMSIPLVYDTHEMYTEIGTLSKVDRFRLRKIEKKYIQSCDAVITVNPYISELLASRYRITLPTVVLNSIGYRPTKERTDKLRLALNLDQSHKIILYQGWISKHRGIEMLIESFEKVKHQAHLVFLGYGEDVSSLSQAIKERGLSERIHFLPEVPQDELRSWTSSADVGVIPYPNIDLNHQYCSPNKLFEFIQARVPIVANDLPFLRDVITHHNIGRVANVANSQLFADALDSVLYQIARQPETFEISLDTASQKFCWENDAIVLKAIYKNLETDKTQLTKLPNA